MSDGLSKLYQELLSGSYDCVDRIVQNGYFGIEIPAVAIVRFEGGKVAREHLYWDQGTVLVQAGLIDPEGLPVAGAEVAAKLKDPTLPSNTLIRTPTKAS